MKHIFCHVPNHTPCTYYRISCPVAYCRHELASYQGIELSVGEGIDYDRHFDALYLMRDYSDDVIAYAHALHRGGVRIAYGLDDDLWNLPEDDPHHESFQKLVPGISYLCELADVILVSTPTLAECAGLRAHDAKIRVCPNLAAPFDVRLPTRPKGQVRILIANSGPKGADLELVVPALSRISREFGPRIAAYCWGNCPPRLRPFVHRLEAVPNADYWPMLAELEPDIFLAPLRDNSFNRCKAPVKWLEAAYAGAVFVGSALPPYDMVRDGEDGLLVPDGDDWYPPLAKVIRDAAFRHTLAANCRQRVLSEWSWCSMARLPWLKAFCAMVQ